MNAVAAKRELKGTTRGHQSEVAELVRVDSLDVLELRAWARAYLYSIGVLELREAVDVLQHNAERDGLAIGQVQQILADAFTPYREAAP